MKLFRKLRDWLAGLFKPKSEKLYKFVYEDSRCGAYRERTLLVVAINPVEATKELYRLTKNDVIHIREFVEIKCNTTGTENVKVRDE